MQSLQAEAPAKREGIRATPEQDTLYSVNRRSIIGPETSRNLFYSKTNSPADSENVPAVQFMHSEAAAKRKQKRYVSELNPALTNFN
jgi:hypothetical protein